MHSFYTPTRDNNREFLLILLIQIGYVRLYFNIHRILIECFWLFIKKGEKMLMRGKVPVEERT